MSRLDHLYRRLLLTKFFTKGWGKPENLKRLFDFRKVISNRELCRHLVPQDYPIHIDKEVYDGDCRILVGHFLSPFTHHMPGIMPKEVETARFQVILPMQWKHTLKPVCLHLAGTGDHFFWRRRLLMAKPLLKESGIASILLENPYYGTRKPKDQLRSSLHNVSDLFVMGGALILESLALLHWCQRQGFGPLGLTGISMGGHMASLAATNWHEPISLIPCLSWSTASAVFTQGVMRKAISWKTLKNQFFENSVYQEEISKLLISPEYEQQAYNMGQEFVKGLTSNNEKLEQTYMEFLRNSFVETNSKDETLKADNQKNVRESLPSSVQLSVKETLGLTGRALDKMDPPILFHFCKPLLHLSGVLAQAFLSMWHRLLNQKLAAHLMLSSQQLSIQGVKTKYLYRMNPSSASGQQLLQHAVSKSKLSHGSQSSSASRDAVLDEQAHSLEQEATNFMIGVMDECTHLGNFSIPIDPNLVIIVAATRDAYVPRQGVIPLDQLWPGSEVRYIDQGHIAAFLLHNNVFRKAITDSFNKQMNLYHQR
ncbi:LOW QUALITY PROTEIN: protein ABHD18-like [Pomacea canaliculata]|nr:LOW QUALITY PROTEIN: protein ABHD18-like [Pomacea canaliculata]